MSAFRTATALSGIAAIRYRNASNVLVTIARGRGRNAANSLKTFFSAMSAALTISEVAGYANSSSPADVTTQGAGVTVTGGAAPLTYLWTRTDGGPHSWTISDPTSSFTYFTCVAVDPLDQQTASFICTVADAGGTSAASNTVTVTANNLGGGF